MLSELAKISSKIADCKLCSLCETRKNTVPGRGKGQLPPWIMFIGEAPGAVEDELGVPFMGDSGSILRETIEGLKFKNYYITNIIKCRPPGNRDPKDEEVDQCIRYLKEQINLLKPRSIVLVGKQAQKAFKRLQIDANGIPIHNVYHPAYYLRRGLRGSYWKEFEGFFETYKQLDPDWVPF